MSHIIDPIDPNAAYIVAAVRSPMAKAKNGVSALSALRPDDLLVQVLHAALSQVPTLRLNGLPTDIVIGTAFPEGEQGFNIARKLVVLAGLPITVTGKTLTRWCASGLQAIIDGCDAVESRTNATEVVIAGGVEMMSRIPMGGVAFRPNPRLTATFQDFYLNMGLTAEAVAKRYGISREDQDLLALESHRRAIAARAKHRPHIVPITVEYSRYGEKGPEKVSYVMTEDDGPRADTSLEALARLKPAFLFNGKGTVTAGNSSQIGDGASICIIASGRVVERFGLTPLARLVSSVPVGNEPRYMGVAPIEPFKQVLAKAELSAPDALVGFNEAFASQNHAVIKEVGFNPEKVNPNGGSIALTHPLGNTGCRDVVDTLWEAITRQEEHFLNGMCVGGGQGVAAAFQNVHPSLHLPTPPSTSPSAEDA